jgi:hypothetical protein
MKLTFDFWGNEPTTMTVDFIHDRATESTQCIIDGKHTGIAYCATHDQFCRAIGRKIAFARVLSHLNFTKEYRRNAWKAYFKAIGKEYK